jgi:hypothetical protein
LTSSIADSRLSYGIIGRIGPKIPSFITPSLGRIMRRIGGLEK